MTILSLAGIVLQTVLAAAPAQAAAPALSGLESWAMPAQTSAIVGKAKKSLALGAQRAHIRKSSELARKFIFAVLGVIPCAQIEDNAAAQQCYQKTVPGALQSEIDLIKSHSVMAEDLNKSFKILAGVDNPDPDQIARLKKEVWEGTHLADLNGDYGDWVKYQAAAVEANFKMTAAFSGAVHGIDANSDAAASFEEFAKDYNIYLEQMGSIADSLSSAVGYGESFEKCLIEVIQANAPSQAPEKKSDSSPGPDQA